MSLFEDVSTLFAAAITDGQDNEAIVKAAYEDLLGYADADTMNNSAARIDYWVQKLSSGELTTDNFGGSFLEEANTNQGSLISSTTFENNQTVVAAHEDAYEANPDVTLEDLTAVAADNRVEDVAEEDEGVTGETFTLTSGIDDLTGTANDDTFEMTTDGQISFDDTLDGGAGSDTLFIRDEGGNTGAFTSTNIETIDARNDVTADVELDNASGYTTLVASAPGALLEFREITAADGLSLDVEANSTTNNVSFFFADDELDGTADSVSTKLSDNSGNFTLNIDDGNGTVETLNVEAASDNTGTTTLDTDADNVETVNVTGSGDVDLAGTLDGETIDASKATGDVTLELGTADQTVTTGSGDDEVDFGTQLGNADTFDGGAGTDTLTMGDGASTTYLDDEGNVENVSNVEKLRLTAELNGATTIDMAQISGLQDVQFDDLNDGGNDQITVSNLLDGATVTLAHADANTDADVAIGFATNTADNDLTLALDGIDFNVLTDTNGFVDDVTIESNEAANTVDNVSGFNADSLTITGDQNLTISGALATNTSSVDSSALTGNLSVTASTTGTELTGGSGNDNLTGDDGSDVLDGGAGNDDLVFQLDGSSSDTMTGGEGNDVFQMENDTIANNANPQLHTITDFSNTGDNGTDELHLSDAAIESIEDSGGDAMNDLLDTGGATNSVGNSGDITFAEVTGNSVDDTLAGGDEMVVLTGATFADEADVRNNGIGAGDSHQFSLGSAAGNAGDAILLAYETDAGDVNIAAAFTTDSADSEDIDLIEDIVTLSGVSANDLLSADLSMDA